jgi:hypothetical protein
MPVLSAANAVQAKTGSTTNNAVNEVYLDAPTAEGNTVTVELFGPNSYPGGPGATVGWEYDANDGAGGRCWVFRRSGVAAGEGVQGSTAWTWDSTPVPFNWLWRATEWDQGLEPVSPLEAWASNLVTGVQATVSTGTTPPTNRAEVVALAMHHWQMAAGNSAQTFDWDAHTNGFVERDELRFTATNTEQDICWSWLFASATGTFECTATANTTPKNVGDAYRGLIVVYAAAQPTMIDPGGVLS